MFSEEQRGLFWLPESPERQVEGSLDPNDQRGLVLTVHGLLGRSLGEHSPERIIGATARGYISLIEPVLVGEKQEINRYTVGQEEIWRCRYAYQGECRDVEKLDTGIKSARIEIQSLREWANTGREIIYSRSLDRGTLSWALDSSPPKAIWSLGKISIQDFVKGPITAGSPFEAHIAVNKFFQVNFERSQALETVLDTASSLQALICISKGEAVAIEHTSVTLRSGSSDTNLLLHYEPVLKADSKPIKQSELLSFEELGGMEGIGRWMDVLKNQTILKNALLADIYRPPIFVTDHTGHLLLANEAFERTVSKNCKGQLNLKKILGPAKDELGAEFFVWIGGDWDKWITKINKIRIRQIAHLQNYPRNKGTGEGLPEINRQLYTVLVVRLLRQCDCSDEVIEEVGQAVKFRMGNSFG